MLAQADTYPLQYWWAAPGWCREHKCGQSGLSLHPSPQGVLYHLGERGKQQPSSGILENVSVEFLSWTMANEPLGWQNQCDSWLLGLNNEIGKCKRKNANVKENVKEISSSKVSSTTAALNEKNNESCFRQCSLNEEDVFKHALRAMQMNLGLIWCLERRSLACF